MKKLLSIALCICLTLAVVFVAAPSFAKADAVTAAAQDLLGTYNVEEYVKITEIMDGNFAVAKNTEYFHGGADSLHRQTLYTQRGAKLYMSDNDTGAINGGYKNDGNDMVRFHINKDGEEVEDFRVVGTEEKPVKVETYYTNIAGFVANENITWSAGDTAEHYETAATIDWVHFIAPMWETDVVTFSYVEMFEENNVLVLKLFAVKGETTALFAQAKINKSLTATAGTQEDTLTFDNTAKRTTFTTEQQVWVENGITLTNNKASASSNVADYANPVRFYKGSSITITAGANITKIVFNATEGASALATDASGIANGTTVTVELETPATTVTYNLTTAKVFVSKITVTTVTAGGECNHFWAVITTPKTCEVDGKVNKYCQLCDATSESVLTACHEWSAWEVTQAPTCSVLGVQERTCSACAETEQKSVNKTEHDWDEGEVTTPAKCEETGVKTYTCQDCPETKEEVIPATDHKFVDGVCTNDGCGATQETVKTKKWVKVTSAPEDWSGTYLIVYEAGKVAFNGGLATFDASGNKISVTITNSEIAWDATNNAASFTIAKSGNGYTIKGASGKYIGNGSNSNALTTSASGLINTLSFNASDKTVNIIGSGGAYLRYNTSGTRFRYYKSSTYTGQKAICLYKYVEE